MKMRQCFRRESTGSRCRPEAGLRAVGFRRLVDANVAFEQGVGKSPLTNRGQDKNHRSMKGDCRGLF
jgi:hypothetical protein